MARIVEEPVGIVASVTGPIYLLLFPIPIVCFLGALITDVVYSRSAQLMWLHFSQWLIAAGLLFGLLAAIALLVLFVAGARIRVRIGWGHLILFCSALIAELFNALIHSRDGFTAVVPTGLSLSVVASILALGAVASLFFMPALSGSTRKDRP